MGKLKSNVLKLTRPAFQAWLESLHPRTKVGIPEHGQRCPIARYIKATTGNSNINVASAQIDLNHNGPNFDTIRDIPKWAKNFICRVDTTRKNSITATHALEILKSSR